MNRANFESQPTLFHRTGKEPYRPANILIVDDDVDSALLIESVFSHLGCSTHCSLDWNAAKKQIFSQKADIIILDWVLNHHTDGGKVVEECARMFDKFHKNGEPGHWKKPKIITYSSLEASEIILKENPYFEHLDHWRKPVTQRDLLHRVLGLLEKTGH